MGVSTYRDARLYNDGIRPRKMHQLHIIRKLVMHIKRILQRQEEKKREVEVALFQDCHEPGLWLII